MDFEIVGPIRDPETIAEGHGIRDLARLQRVYGAANWRKRKGTATVRTPTGRVRTAEVHWYEGHGIGKRDFKIKRYLDEA